MGADQSENQGGINVNVPADVVRDASQFLQRILGPVANAADLLSDKIRLAVAIRFAVSVSPI